MCACDPHALFVAQVCEVIQILCPHNMTISISNTIRETIYNKTEFGKGSFFLQLILFCVMLHFITIKMSLKNAAHQCTQVVCDQAAREQKVWRKESLAERERET